MVNAYMTHYTNSALRSLKIRILLKTVVGLLGVSTSLWPTTPQAWHIGLSNWGIPATSQRFQTVYWLNPDGSIAYRPAQMEKTIAANVQMLTVGTPMTHLAGSLYAGLSFGINVNSAVTEKTLSNVPLRSAGVAGEFLIAPSYYSRYMVEENHTMSAFPLELSVRWGILQGGIGGCLLLLERKRITQEFVMTTYGTMGEYRAGDTYTTTVRDSLNTCVPFARVGVRVHQPLFDGVVGGISLQGVYTHPTDNVVSQEQVLNVAWSDRPADRRIVNKQDGLRAGGYGFALEVYVLLGGSENIEPTSGASRPSRGTLQPTPGTPPGTPPYPYW